MGHHRANIVGPPSSTQDPSASIAACHSAASARLWKLRDVDVDVLQRDELLAACQRDRIIKTIEIIPIIPCKPEVTVGSTRCSLSLKLGRGDA
jgi:hypothetical protein